MPVIINVMNYLVRKKRGQCKIMIFVHVSLKTGSKKKSKKFLNNGSTFGSLFIQDANFDMWHVMI